MGQTERVEGVQSHLKRGGNSDHGRSDLPDRSRGDDPVLCKGLSGNVIPVLFVTVGFGIIGFLDDYIKIMLHRSEGLTPPQKMLGQFLVTGIFVFYYCTI